MDFKKLKEILKEKGQPEFRFKQIVKSVYQDGVSSFSQITTLPKDLREVLEKEIMILPFKEKKVLVSADNRSVKALLELTSGQTIETVLISPKPGIWSACVSSQVGCPMRCAFCATGKSGFKKNLTHEEISGQVLFWKQYLKKINKESAVASVVYMGMGEPFLNWDNVSKSIKLLNDKEIFNLASRRISISTCGIPEGIKKLSKEFPQVNLAVSLHFSDNKKRSAFMPVNRKYNLLELAAALKDYFKLSRRKVFIEYIMFDGLNDNKKDADDLVKYLDSIGDTYLLHVNLIPYNEASGEFRPSSPDRVIMFKNYLLRNHLSVTVRKSLGGDIFGACGQLSSNPSK